MSYITRRGFLGRTARGAGALLALPYLLRSGRPARAEAAYVNDVHSHLNRTPVTTILKPASLEELPNLVADAASNGRTLSLAGARHAMGGQQFATDADHIDLSGLNRIISFDRDKGIIEVEGGAVWPTIIDYCWAEQAQDQKPWSITQKQTGADALTIGGAISANIHGRGLTMRPFIQDVESFDLVTPKGEEITCSRSENSELFKLAAGGYGLFGIVSRARLRLMPRTGLRRTVKILDVNELIPAFEERIKAGYMYGDFQYMTDATSPDFMTKGVFSCYQPVAEAPPESEHRQLSEDDWKNLYRLAFADKGGAYTAYSQYYLSTDGQFYWSDKHQLSVYLENYHVKVNEELGFKDKASLMISEIYVPREHFAGFMRNVQSLARKSEIDIIYGTVRLIEQDDESFLAWARTNYACVIFNLRVFHTPAGIQKAQRDFRALIDTALPYGGSYYLTYHRWADQEQVVACHPRLPEFLRLKKEHDPQETIQSDWYRHYRTMFG